MEANAVAVSLSILRTEALYARHQAPVQRIHREFGAPLDLLFGHRVRHG